MKNKETLEKLNKIRCKNPSAEEIRFLKECAGEGYVIAANNLGIMYLNGFGVEKDNETAFRYLKMANDNNPLAALRTLGDMYFYGLGTEVNFEKAFELYRRDVEKEHKGLSSEDRLAECYIRGKGVKADAEKAAEYFELAAKQIQEMIEMGCGLIQSVAPFDVV